MRARYLEAVVLGFTAPFMTRISDGIALVGKYYFLISDARDYPLPFGEREAPRNEQPGTHFVSLSSLTESFIMKACMCVLSFLILPSFYRRHSEMTC